MLVLMKTAFLTLLLLTCFFTFHSSLALLISHRKVRSRLRYVQHKRFSRKMERLASRYARLYRHLAELLESSQSTLQAGSFLWISVILFLVGILAGGFILTGLKGMVVLGIMMGTCPYVILRMRLIGIQMRRRLDFLPAVEVFYQYYLLSEQGNIRNVLMNLVEENRIMYPMRTVFVQLQRNLAIQRDLDESLRLFQMATGHVWANYFVNILRVGLVEGVNVADNLRELIEDMRKAQRANQAERNRLLEIRIANFTPLLFLILFLLINFRLDETNAYHYYFVEPAGRHMLLDSLLLIFLSFVMGVYLSIKKI